MFVWNMGFPLTQYMLDADINEKFATFLTIISMVALVTYIGVPVMHMFFGNWLNLPRKKNKKFKHLKYFRFLDVGVSFYMKIVICITFVLANTLSNDVSE